MMQLPEFNKDKISLQFSKTNEVIIKIAAAIGAVTVILGGYSFYINNFWTPKVEIISVDFKSGIAQVKHRKKVIDIYGDATFQISKSGDWGIKFGSNKGNYESLQLVKKGMVVEYLKR